MNVHYARARLYGAVEIALVGLLLILGTLRASGASPAPDAAIADLARQLKSPKLETRLSAAQALGKSRATGPRVGATEPRVGAAEAAEALLGALQTEKHPAAQEYLVAALGDLGDPSAVSALAALAAKAPEPGAPDPGTGLRAGAVLALHQIGSPQALAALERLAQDPAQPGAVRKGCLLSLGQRQGPGAVATLSAALKDKDPGVREAAVDALGRVEDTRAEAAFSEALSDPDPIVRKSAQASRERAKKRTGRPRKPAQGAPR